MQEVVMGLLEMTHEHYQLQQDQSSPSPDQLKLRLVYHPFYSIKVCYNYGVHSHNYRRER